MLFLKLRQAEVAMADGRLDEACDLLMQDEIRDHRQGQKLTNKLVARLLKRADAHFKDERIEEAQHDLRRASRFGGNQPGIAQFSEKIRDYVAAAAKQQQQQRQVLQAVRNEMNRGEWSLGGRLLQKLSDSCSQAGLMADELEIRRESSDAAVSRARDAISGGKFDNAVNQILTIHRDYPAHPEFGPLLTEFSQLVATQFHAEAVSGRLDRLDILFSRLGPLLKKSVELSSLKTTLAQCRSCSDAIRRSDFRLALQLARQLKPALSAAAWLDDVVSAAQQAADAQDALRSSPLALLSDFEETVVPVKAAPEPPAQRREIPRVKKSTPEANIGSWLLQVEGAGSFLVLTADSNSLGSVSSSTGSDISLMGSVTRFHIDRQQEDYFLRAKSPVGVNQKSLTEKLLVNGDRIQAGRRAGMKFLLPYAASTTAVLELGTARLQRPDIRRVILCDDTIVIGDTRNAHVPVSSGEDPFLIVYRNGRFQCRPIGRNVDPANVQDVKSDVTCVCGSVSFKLASGIV